MSSARGVVYPVTPHAMLNRTAPSEGSFMRGLHCFLSLYFLLCATAARGETFESWQSASVRDEMDGSISRSISTKSKEIFEGWLRTGRVHLSYRCESGFYVYAEEIGFESNYLFDAQGAYGQFVRYRVDDGPVTSLAFLVWQNNIDGMSLDVPPASRTDVEEFRDALKRGETLHLELEAFSTKGRQQVLRFDLHGFTRAYEWCGEPISPGGSARTTKDPEPIPAVEVTPVQLCIEFYKYHYAHEVIQELGESRAPDSCKELGINKDNWREHIVGREVAE